MACVHIDPIFGDDERRHRIFAGDVVVYTHVAEVAAFAEFTRDLITEAMAPDEPTRVHTTRTAAELADLLIEFKPRFIHHPESIAHVRRIAGALGTTSGGIYADVPRLRTAFPTGGLNTGIAYAFQPHRDTWYAAPPQQVNWWLPVWPVAEDNIMEFYPRWFGRAIDNTSGDYSYYQANSWRGHIKDFSGGRDMRVHPAPVCDLPSDEPRLRVVPPVGGVMLFSGDQLHASVPNTSGSTRYSIDFRTVHQADVHEDRGAPVVDVACTGTSLRDFTRLDDHAAFADEVVARFDTEGAEGIKIYVPS
jgi:hypothetical protein